MRQDKINALIPLAMEAIKKVGISNDDGVVNKTYESYIAGFGSNIRQSGLLPTLIFFQNDGGKSQRSSLWLKAILYVIQKDKEIKNEQHTIDYKKDNLIGYVIDESKKKDKSEYQIKHLKLDNLEEQILDIVCALKMAVRTFKLDKNG